MSANVHYTQITDPALLDIVDEAWLRDKLPDDNVLPAPISCLAKHLRAAAAVQQCLLPQPVHQGLCHRGKGSVSGIKQHRATGVLIPRAVVQIQSASDCGHNQVRPPIGLRKCACLIHADIPLPPGAHGMADEMDDLQQEQRPAAKQKDKWLDLGLQNLH